MNCKSAHKFMIEYLEGSLQPSVQKELEEHISHCKECESFAAYLQLSFHEIETEKDTEYDPWMYSRIQAKLSGIRTPSISVKRRILQPALITILFLVMVFAGFSLGKSYSTNHTLASDYQTEMLYLTDITDVNFESITQTK